MANSHEIPENIVRVTDAPGTQDIHMDRVLHEHLIYLQEFDPRARKELEAREIIYLPSERQQRKSA